jgi:DNA-binding transcriptional LysR family regulator
VENIKLLEEDLSLIFSPNEKERYTNPQPVHPILDKPLLVFGRSDTYRYKSVEHPILHDYQRQHHIQFKKIIYIDQIEPLKKLIKQGNGIAFLPHFLIEHELNLGELASAPIIPPLRPMGIHLIYRKLTNESTLRVIELIRHHFFHKSGSY